MMPFTQALVKATADKERWGLSPVGFGLFLFSKEERAALVRILEDQMRLDREKIPNEALRAKISDFVMHQSDTEQTEILKKFLSAAQVEAVVAWLDRVLTAATPAEASEIAPPSDVAILQKRGGVLQHAKDVRSAVLHLGTLTALRRFFAQGDRGAVDVFQTLAGFMPRSFALNWKIEVPCVACGQPTECCVTRLDWSKDELACEGHFACAGCGHYGELGEGVRPYTEYEDATGKTCCCASCEEGRRNVWKQFRSIVRGAEKGFMAHYEKLSDTIVALAEPTTLPEEVDMYYDWETYYPDVANDVRRALDAKPRDVFAFKRLLLEQVGDARRYGVLLERAENWGIVYKAAKLCRLEKLGFRAWFMRALCASRVLILKGEPSRFDTLKLPEQTFFDEKALLKHPYVQARIKVFLDALFAKDGDEVPEDFYVERNYALLRIPCDNFSLCIELVGTRLFPSVVDGVLHHSCYEKEIEFLNPNYVEFGCSPAPDQG